MASSHVIVSSTPNADGTTTFAAWEEVVPGTIYLETQTIDDIEYGRIGTRLYERAASFAERMTRYDRRQKEYDEAYAVIRDHVSYIDRIQSGASDGRIVVKTTDMP